MFESLLKYIVRSVLQKVIYEGFFLSYFIAFLTLHLDEHFRCNMEFGACMRVYERKRKEYKGRLKRDGNHHTRNGKCATSQPR